MCQTWVKLISVYGRKEGFSREEFFIYQAGPHMRKAGQVPEFCGRIKDSYQSGIIQPEEWPVLASISNLPRTDQKDSIVEIFFESAESAYAAFHEPNYLKIIRPDEEYFSDTRNGWSVLTRETVLREGSKAAYQMILFFHWKKDVENAWETDRPRLLSQMEDLGLKRATESVRIADMQMENSRDYDLVLKLGFEQEEALLHVAETRLVHSYLWSLPYIAEDMITYCTLERRNTPR